MPGFDGTGPAGMGPMTGRGMGYCAQPIRDDLVYEPVSYRMPAYPPANYGFPPRFWGRGWGRGFGRGRGFAVPAGRQGWGRGRRFRMMYGW